MRSSLPTMSVGRTMSARPPRMMATLVVMLPIMARSGGDARGAMPKMKSRTPTQTMPFRLAGFAPISRAVSFWAAPSSVAARVSSRSVTGMGAERWNERSEVRGRRSEEPGEWERWAEWDEMGIEAEADGANCVPAGTVYVRTLTVSWDWRDA